MIEPVGPGVVVGAMVDGGGPGGGADGMGDIVGGACGVITCTGCNPCAQILLSSAMDAISINGSEFDCAYASISCIEPNWRGSESKQAAPGNASELILPVL